MTVWYGKVEIDGHTVQLASDKEGGHITGYSFSQGKYYGDPLSLLPPDYKPTTMSKSPEEVAQELEDIATYMTVDVPSRSLKKEYLEYFDVKTGVDRSDGETVTTLHFPFKKGSAIVGYETKLLSPKKFWRVGETKECDMFGWDRAISSGSPKLFITEGPVDTVSLFQILKDKAKGTKWAANNPAVVSIPHGTGSAKAAISKHILEINSYFSEIVLVFDGDEAGVKAVDEVSRVVPSAKSAVLPLNDVNECLMEGRSLACANSVLFKASKKKNTRLIRGSELSERAKVPAEWGISWPWEELTQLTKGIRRGEIIIVGAGVSMGKSILLSAFASDMIVTHDNPVLIVKAEEAAVKTYQELVAQVAERRFNDPSIEFDGDAYDAADKQIKDKAIIVDSYQFIDFEILKGDIVHAITEDGVKDIYIDPLTCLVNDMSSSEANELLNKAMAELAAMALDYGVTFYLFSHLNNPKTGPPHEEGGAVHVNQLTNSRGMMRSAHLIFGLEGDKSPELPEEMRNTRFIVLLKDREHGVTGKLQLFWDKLSGKFKEV